MKAFVKAGWIVTWVLFAIIGLFCTVGFIMASGISLDIEG